MSLYLIKHFLTWFLIKGIGVVKSEFTQNPEYTTQVLVHNPGKFSTCLE